MDTGSLPPDRRPAHGDESGTGAAGIEQMPPRPLAGLVLCGGESRRMGADKAVATIAGERLVERVARRLATIADPLLVASGTPGRLGPLPWHEVADARPGRGPLGGLVAGLEASPHALVAVVAVDLPFASPRLLRSLAEGWDGEDASIPLDEDGRRQPLHAVYTRRIGAHLRGALDHDRLAIGRALEGLDVRLVPASEWRAAGVEPRWARNVNTAKDLAAAAADTVAVQGIDPTPGGLGYA